MKKLVILSLVAVFLLAGILFAKFSPLGSINVTSTRVLGTATLTQPIRHVDLPAQSPKLVALTFDDGPSPATQEILEILADKGVRATFFVVGENIDDQDWLLRETFYQEHEIGNHTNTHPISTFMSDQNLAKDILIAEQKIFQETKIRPKLLRAPYALYPRKLLETADLLGMRLIGWDVDPEDWRKTNSEIITNRVLTNVESGSIILLHDGPPDLDRSQTVEALPGIIDGLREKEFELVTVSELLEAGAESERIAGE